MLPTKSTLLASPAAVIWSHTRGLQQVISVMESPSSTSPALSISSSRRQLQRPVLKVVTH
jgi:hypothetical protein